MNITLQEVIFWAIWGGVTSGIWGVLSIALRPTPAPASEPKPVLSIDDPIKSAAIATFIQVDPAILELETELAAYHGVDLQPEDSDLAWAEEHARRLGLMTIAALRRALLDHREEVLRLAGKFQWSALRRGDPLRLLFTVLYERAVPRAANLAGEAKRSGAQAVLANPAT